MSLECSYVAPGSGHRRIIHPGYMFKKWTVIKEVPSDELAIRKFECRCECGAISVLRANNLTSPYKSKTCISCKHKNVGRRNATHGMHNTPTYRSWEATRGRCYRKNIKSFENYGGRGIKVCDRWRYSFENFLSDMGVCPQGYQLDRIDVDGDYEPGNCRWVSRQENMDNRRNSKKNKHKYVYVLKEKLCNTCIKKAGSSNVDACTGEPPEGLLCN